MKITAAVTEEKSGPFVLQELEVGELAADEILVGVEAVGICHTDLIVRDQWLPTTGATRLELTGSWGTSGTLTVMTNDVSLKGNPYVD